MRMKIAIAQLNSIVGNFEFNLKKCVDSIEEAIKNNCDLIIFPELYTTGYFPIDLLKKQEFRKKSDDFIKTLTKYSNDIAIIIGGINNFYNSAFFLYRNKIDYQGKSLLPTYDVFNETRYFEAANEWRVIEYKNRKIMLSVCEDMWGNTYENINCFDLFINISASPFEIGKLKKRIEIMKNICVDKRCKGIYVNTVGANDSLVFDGSSFVIDERGNLLFLADRFKEGLYFFNLDEIRPASFRSDDNEKEIIDAIILGIRDYFYKTGFDRAVLGLSGGIDSAVVAVLACIALGKDNVKPILLPGPFSSSGSVDDALLLCKNLEIEPIVFDIKEIYELYNKKLEPVFKGKSFDVTEENLQARIRANILLAYSNKFNALVLNTGNKSEIFSGYSTLYGDSVGAISVIGDLYKTEVYKIASYINREREIIPLNIIKKSPSAELRPNQKDEDSLPPYDILDKILKDYLENNLRPEEIAKKNKIDLAVIRDVLKRIYTSEYKRRQSPLVIRLRENSVAGLRFPIANHFRGF